MPGFYEPNANRAFLKFTQYMKDLKFDMFDYQKKIMEDMQKQYQQTQESIKVAKISVRYMAVYQQSMLDEQIKKTKNEMVRSVSRIVM